ncbi:MAG TPA: PqqD family protein [Polyangiaceae bacterium]
MRKKELDPSLFLDATPTVNQAVRVERHGETILLYVPIQQRWWMEGVLTWLLPFRKEKGVALDAIGRQVWEACDGKRTLEQIIEQFGGRHKIRFHEARISVMQFVRLLVRRGLLVLAMPAGTEAR